MPTTLSSLPYEIHLGIVCELDDLKDVISLARSCKAFFAPLQHHPTNIYSQVAARQYRDSGYWEELVNLLRASAARERLKGLNQNLEPAVYRSPNQVQQHTITRTDVPSLLSLVEAVRGICSLGTTDGTWPAHMRDDTELRHGMHLALLDVVVAGQSFLRHPSCGEWREYEYVNLVTQRLVQLNDLKGEVVERLLGFGDKEGEGEAGFRRYVSKKMVACFNLLQGGALDGTPGWPLWA